MTKLIDADALKDKRHFTKEQALKIALNTNVPFSSHDTQHVFNTAQIEEMLNLAATAAIANAPTVQREHNKYCGGKIELAYGSANCGSAFHGSIMKCDNCASEPTVQREGWVSVPIEPTSEMINAAIPQIQFYKTIPDVYKAMIQAAPTDKE